MKFLFRHPSPEAFRSPALCAGLFRYLRPLFLFLFVIQHSPFVIPLAAFPPALPHTIEGMARDEYGNPLVANATIVLTTAAGVSISSKVIPGLEAGVNYRLIIPMDSGVRSDFYKATALQAAVPFRLRVTINTTTYLPIEMTGDYSLLGLPGKKTRIDLTLGEDANGNGLPDAWERAVIAARGLNLVNLNPNASVRTNGATLLQEYIAGTYAFDDGSGLSLAISRFEAGAPVLEFLAIRGRNYGIVGSGDLKSWQAVNFQLAGPGADPAVVENLQSTAVQLMQVKVPATGNQAGLRFFKLRIQ